MDHKAPTSTLILYYIWLSYGVWHLVKKPTEVFFDILCHFWHLKVEKTVFMYFRSIFYAHSKQIIFFSKKKILGQNIVFWRFGENRQFWISEKILSWLFFFPEKKVVFFSSDLSSTSKTNPTYFFSSIYDPGKVENPTSWNTLIPNPEFSKLNPESRIFKNNSPSRIPIPNFYM